MISYLSSEKPTAIATFLRGLPAIRSIRQLLFAARLPLFCLKGRQKELRLSSAALKHLFFFELFFYYSKIAFLIFAHYTN